MRAIRVAYAGYRVSRCRKGSHRRSTGANRATAFVKAGSVQAQADSIPLPGTLLKGGVVALAMPPDDAQIRTALRSIFDAAIASADPRRVLASHLPSPPPGRVIVVGAGKSAALMAAALEAAWPHVPLEGLVVTRYGHAVPTRRIEVMEAAHPVPDANSQLAAERILTRLRNLEAADLVIALISGGGSALLALPAPGLTLADKQAVSEQLLASGATIHEMNAVRKHLSAIKGGRLALAAAPARVLTLAISDIPGDDPRIIASGPTLADESNVADVRAIVERYRLELPAEVMAFLRHAPETPKPGAFPEDVRLIATPSGALRAAAERARQLGLTPVVLGELEGESRDLGIVMAGIARSVRANRLPVAPPAVILSGGETVVTIGDGPAGRGGRNLEFLLSLAIALDGAPDIWALAGDTDGRDGSEDAAGAVVTPDTLVRAHAAKLDPRDVLHRHDSFTLFDAIGDIVHTGPTLTNVNALRAVLIA
jgi:glycerate 2-kinase